MKKALAIALIVVGVISIPVLADITFCLFAGFLGVAYLIGECR